MLPGRLGLLLHHCAKTKAFRYGLPLHAAAIKTGVHSDTIIGNHILNFYAKCDNIDSAQQLFVEMPNKNMVSWSAMISGYDQSKRPHLALQVFTEMQKYFKPNEFVFSSALSSCSEVRELKLGQQIHAQALQLGYASVSFVLNSLILMYMKCGGMCSEALSIFTLNDSCLFTLVSYNVAIAGLVENEQEEMGIEIFKVLCRQGLIPDRFTFAALLGTSEPKYHPSVVMQLQCVIVKLGQDCNAFPGNLLIALYSKFDLIEESEKVFSSIGDMDAISWNTIIAACYRCEEYSKALSFFSEMVMSCDVVPDDFVFASILSVCAAMASVGHGKEIHANLIRTRRNWDVGVGNALINMYAKNGSIVCAIILFEQMEVHNLVSWNTIIAAFANHGLGKKAIALFEDMERIGIKPDSVTFLGLLTACNHSGLLDEAQILFKSMSEDYEITPSTEHICCLVDLLGRGGRVSEAEEYLQNYSMGSDAVVLGSLLSACLLHGDVIVGERIAKRLMDLNPVTSSPYVLLSNLYASDRKWDGVAGTRKMLQGSGVKKETACSVIEVKGSIEKFVVGDFSHSRMGEMMSLLRTFSWRKYEVCYAIEELNRT